MEKRKKKWNNITYKNIMLYTLVKTKNGKNMFYKLQCGISLFLKDQFVGHYVINYFVKLQREMAAYLHAQTNNKRLRLKFQ